MAELSQQQYQVLFAFRCALRHYLQWSAGHAARFGLAPQQAQLLLAIRVRPSGAPPSISDLATALQIRQHSAVGLANRAQRAGLVVRSIDPHDQRVVRIALSPRGHEVIAALAETHLAELHMVAAALHLSDEFLENLSEQFSGLLPGDDDLGAAPDQPDAAGHGNEDNSGDPYAAASPEPAQADTPAAATHARRQVPHRGIVTANRMAG